MIKIKRQNLSNQVYAIIKEMILDYRFQPGVRINVEHLARQIGVSRTPAWGAVYRLLQEGLLVNIPNRGMFMTELTPEKAVELYTVRCELEGLAARLAAGHMDDNILDKTAQNLKEQKRVIENEDLNAYSRLSFEFHKLTTKPAKNSVLREMLESIRNKMKPFAVQIVPLLPKLYEDHVAIFEAFKTGDPDVAEYAFRSHNRRLLDEIKKTLKSKIPGG